jgi:hypothetical protein
LRSRVHGRKSYGLSFDLASHLASPQSSVPPEVRRKGTSGHCYPQCSPMPRGSKHNHDFGLPMSASRRITALLRHQWPPIEWLIQKNNTQSCIGRIGTFRKHGAESLNGQCCLPFFFSCRFCPNTRRDAGEYENAQHGLTEGQGHAAENDTGSVPSKYRRYFLA